MAAPGLVPTRDGGEDRDLGPDVEPGRRRIAQLDVARDGGQRRNEELEAIGDQRVHIVAGRRRLHVAGKEHVGIERPRVA